VASRFIFSFWRHPLRETRRIAQLLHSEHRIAQLRRLTPLERVRRQFFELGYDLRSLAKLGSLRAASPPSAREGCRR